MPTGIRLNLKYGLSVQSPFSTTPPSSSLPYSISCRVKGSLYDSENASTSPVVYLGTKSICNGQVNVLLPSMQGIKVSHFCLLMKNVDILEQKLSDSDVTKLERDILVHIERLGALSLFHKCLYRTLSPNVEELSPSFTYVREDIQANCPVEPNVGKFVQSMRKKKRRSRARCSLESSSQTYSKPIRKDMKKSTLTCQRSRPKSRVYRLRVAKSEGEMSRGVKLLNELERIREALKSNGQVVSLSSWSQAARVDNKVLQEWLRFGWSCRDQLLRSTRSLVIYLARNYRGSGVAIEDLIQAGYSGVLQGAERFDDTRGYKFSTYVQYWIRKAMSMLVSQHARGIRIPTTLSSAIKKIQKARKALSCSHGKNISDSDIAEYTGLSIAKISSASKCLRVVGSLDKKIGDPASPKFKELTPDTSIPTPEKTVMIDHMKKDLYKLLDSLEPRERQVLILRFGIGNHRCKSLEETGKHFSLSKEWVRKIERTALQKLRNEDSLHNLKHYIYR